MKNLTIEQRLWAFALVFALLLGVQMLVVNGLTRTMANDMRANAEVNKPMTRAFHKLQVSVIQTQQWLTDISATRARDGLDDGFKEAQAAADDFRDAIETLTRKDPTRADKYKALLPIYRAYYDSGRRMAEAYIENGAEGGNPMMADFDQTAEAIYGQVDRFMAEFSRAENARLELQLDEAQQLEHRNYIFGLAYVALFFVMVFGVYRFVIRPARALARTLEGIAMGDLSHKVSIDSHDEIGLIAQKTNLIVEELGRVLSEVSSQGMLISAYSQATNLVVQETAEGVANQRERASEIISVMEVMNQSVDRIDELSGLAQGSAQRANDEAVKGRGVVERNIESINRLAQDIHAAEERIQQLNESSATINTVLKVIHDIAEQTNLLALNAAIEAARAGEQGRGFAVVADEVRILAARTQGSAREVKEMVEAFQDGTRSFVETMGKSQQQAQQLVDQSSMTADSLQAIAEAVESIRSMNDQVVAATSSQKEVSTQVNARINDIVNAISDVQKKSATATTMGRQTRQHATDFTSLVVDLKLLKQR